MKRVGVMGLAYCISAFSLPLWGPLAYRPRTALCNHRHLYPFVRRFTFLRTALSSLRRWPSAAGVHSGQIGRRLQLEAGTAA